MKAPVLSYTMKQELISSCNVTFQDPITSAVKRCEGPTLIEIGEEIQEWPHIVAFRLTQSWTKLSELPLAFNFRDSVLVLRSVILHQTGHFTAAVRAPKAWMFYDGYKPPHHLPPRFTFYNLDETEEFMYNKTLDTVLYEVLEGQGTSSDPLKNEKNLFDDYDYDWSQSFHVSNPYPGHTDYSSEDTAELGAKLRSATGYSSPSKKQNSPGTTKKQQQHESQGDMDKKIRKLNNDLSKASNSPTKRNSTKVTGKKAAKRKEPLPKTKDSPDLEERKKKRKSSGSVTVKRIQKGWFYRHTAPSRGPKPACKSCGAPIEYTDECVLHGYYEKKHFKQLTRDQYHCRKSCIQNMSRATFDDFMEQFWTARPVLEVIKDINKENKKKKK